jgi:hypothetical protein
MTAMDHAHLAEFLLPVATTKVLGACFSNAPDADTLDAKAKADASAAAKTTADIEAATKAAAAKKAAEDADSAATKAKAVAAEAKVAAEASSSDESLANAAAVAKATADAAVQTAIAAKAASAKTAIAANAAEDAELESSRSRSRSKVGVDDEAAAGTAKPRTSRTVTNSGGEAETGAETEAEIEAEGGAKLLALALKASLGTHATLVSIAAGVAAADSSPPTPSSPPQQPKVDEARRELTASKVIARITQVFVPQSVSLAEALAKRLDALGHEGTDTIGGLVAKALVDVSVEHRLSRELVDAVSLLCRRPFFNREEKRGREREREREEREERAERNNHALLLDVLFSTQHFPHLYPHLLLSFFRSKTSMLHQAVAAGQRNHRGRRQDLPAQWPQWPS